MSRTDKTDPEWVKLNRYGHESHDHTHGECDYRPRNNHHRSWWPRERAYSPRFRHTFTWAIKPRCDDEQPYRAYYDSNWYWRPKGVRWEANRMHRAERQRVRMALRTGEEDIAPYRPRGAAMWHYW
jgi:hypothetical protein